jgi:hypothetical protein
MSLTVFTTLQTGGNVTTIRSILERGLSDPISAVTIPGRYFVSGATYNFVLRLTNYLGKSTTSAKSVVPYNANNVVSVVVEGVPRVFVAQDVLVLTMMVQISNPYPSSVYVAQYSWSVYLGPYVDTSVVSTNSSSRVMSLNPYTLTPGLTYLFVATATLSTGSSAQTSVTVYVMHGDVVAVIGGGSVRSIAHGFISRIGVQLDL